MTYFIPPHLRERGYDALELYWLEYTTPSGVVTCIVPAALNNLPEAKACAHWHCGLTGEAKHVTKPNLGRVPRKYLARILSNDDISAIEKIIAGATQ